MSTVGNERSSVPPHDPVGWARKGSPDRDQPTHLARDFWPMTAPQRPGRPGGPHRLRAARRPGPAAGSQAGGEISQPLPYGAPWTG